MVELRERHDSADGLEALIEEAWQRTRRRRRRQILTVAVTAMLLAGLVVGVVKATSDSANISGRPAGRPAAAGGSRAAGSYWYTRAILTDRQPLPIVPHVMRVGQRAGPVPTIYFDVRTRVETWIGRDGTIRQRSVVVSRRFATPAGRRRWVRARQTLPGGASGGDSLIAGDGMFPASPYAPSGEPGDPGDGLLSFAQLLSLPRAAPALLAWLQRAQEALDRRELDTAIRPGPRRQQIIVQRAGRAQRDQNMLNTIAELTQAPIPDRLRLELVRAGGRLPGVKAFSEGGVIRLTGSIDGGPGSVSFDSRTGQLLEQSGSGLAGSTRVTAQGSTVSPWALPAGVAPAAAARRIPAPVKLTVSPSSGVRETNFALDIPRPRDPARARAPFLQAAIYGPTGPDCTFWNSHAPTAMIPAGRLTSAGGQPVYRYRLASAAIQRAGWCPGRYQIQVTPLRLTTGASQTLAGPSAVYFSVR